MFLLNSEQISAMTYKDALRGTVKSVAGPELMDRHNPTSPSSKARGDPIQGLSAKDIAYS